MNKLVSIIVPVYNVEKYLERCIESLLNQTYKNIEILLIDDGSTDCSGAICDKYSKQARVFHQANRGVSAARNIGLKYMQGDFVCFVDPDDYISPYLIEKAMDSAIKHNADIVIFDYSCIKDGKVIKEHNIRFIEGLNFYEDDAFTLEFFQYAQSLRTIPTCLYNYIINENGLTMASNSCEEFETFIDANIKNMQFIKHKELYNYELHRLFDFLLQATRQAKRQNRKAMYNHLIKKAHKFYLDFIRPNNIWIRKVYRQKYFWLFKINIVLHKR